jgi:hypothetical protein
MMPWFTLALCAGGAVYVVSRHDRYCPKPLRWRGLAVAFGFAAMAFAARLEEWTFGAMGAASPYALSAVAAVEEELLKVISVLALCLLLRVKMNDPMAGIVYGSLAGLGMGLEESVYYLRQLPAGALLLPPEELVRLSGHLVMGGIGTFGIGSALRRCRHWRLILAGCLTAAITLHLGFDWIILAPGDGAPLGALESWSAAALMLAGFLLYGALTAMASEQSRLLFDPQGPRRLWGWPFTARTHS